MPVFITNRKIKNSLRARLEELIQHSCELKFLIGFFYFSGWSELVDALKKRDDLAIKLLVGLDVDHLLDQTLEVALSSDGLSNAELTDNFFSSISKALNDDALDIEEFYAQVSYFIELLENGRMEIKKTLKPNHAKLYFFKAGQHLEGWLAEGETGKFITGSSNLTRAGIRGQDEFNVEIGDYGTREAEDYFDQLWLTAVPITEDQSTKDALIRLVRNRTQVAEISPYEAYVLVLKTYLDLMKLKTIRPFVTRLLEEGGYTSYQYQMDAVSQALSIIEQYNGVIVADVVGLGKTIIACMIARDLGKRGMVICPPGIMGDNHYETGWKKYLADFELRRYEWEVYSCGNLEGALDYLQGDNGQDIEVIIIDEAHRFRNEDTESFEVLSAICRNRKVVLLTATPFNNTPADIFSLLKLFVIPGKSALTLDENLEGRFRRYNRDFYRLSFITRYYQTGGEKQNRAGRYYEQLFDEKPPINIKKVRARTHILAAEIRAVLEPILIRRNRIDLKMDPVYCNEVKNLSEIQDPFELFFELTPEQLDFYDQVVNDYFGDGGRFKGAIYQPFLYEKRENVDGEKLDIEGNRTFLQQRNLYDFMRRLLVKRFESSFGAFAQSIENFKRVHKVVLKFIETSGGRYILDRKLIEKIYEDDPEDIDAALDEFASNLSKEKTIPKHERIYQIDQFDFQKEFMSDIQSDLALMQEVSEKLVKLNLVDEDSKSDCLISTIEEIINSKPPKSEPRRKVIVFSEYVDTVKHLRPKLEAAFQYQILTVAGNLTRRISKEVLLNFDASVRKKAQHDDFQILLTSDKLSEGVNLNRAGAVINYDIPWNPTRVIQRVGRINRIGKKVFETLSVYNFFPTEEGADIVKSREIATQKMFLIHSTLGEDAKIFSAEETPSASELYKRVNRKPEEDEEESLYTRIRQKFFEVGKSNPEILKKIADYPARVKTAKSSEENQLTVFRRKGLGLFIQNIEDTHSEKPETSTIFFEEGLDKISCSPDERRLKLSEYFWPSYNLIKKHKDQFRQPSNENSIEVKAFNNLKTAVSNHADKLGEWLPFINTLIKDIRDYKTLPRYTLRRLAIVELDDDGPGLIEDFIEELKTVRNYLGEDYLDVIEERISSIISEIIIAVENQDQQEFALPTSEAKR